MDAPAQDPFISIIFSSVILQNLPFMKLKVILLSFGLLVFSIFNLSARTNSLSGYGYPAYSEVLQHFFNTYTGKPVVETLSYRFAKKTDGWHLQIIDPYNGSLEKSDELLWSRASKEYQKLSLPLKQEDEDNSAFLDQFSKDWSTNYFFAILPYYNYPGYTWDIINDLQDKSDLTDTLMNALARAYTFSAADLLNNNSGFSLDSKRYSVPEGLNCLSPAQLNEYKRLEHLGISTYYRLYKMNPAFENFVADAFNIYSNEVMNCFLYLRTYQNEEEAKKELVPGLYDSFMIDMAKNMLNSCAKDAILLTNGDLDTYPLLYVQSQMGFRTDVLVANVSLLSTKRYLDYLCGGVNQAKPLSLCAAEGKLREGKLAYALVKISLNVHNDLQSLLNYAISDDPATKFEYQDVKYNIFPSGSAELGVDRDAIARNKVISSDDQHLVVDTLRWEVPGQVLFANNLVVLEMVACSNFQRPIYFANTLEKESMLGLDNYQQLDGLASRLVPIYTEADTVTYINWHINKDMLYQTLTGSFAIDYIGHPPSCWSQAHFRFISNQRLVYVILADLFADANEGSKADTLLETGLSMYPYDKTPVDLPLIKFSRCYYQLGNTGMGDKLAEALCQTNYDFIKNEAARRGIDDYQVRLAQYNLSVLSNLTNVLYPRDELGKKIKKAEDECNLLLSKNSL